MYSTIRAIRQAIRATLRAPTDLHLVLAFVLVSVLLLLCDGIQPPIRGVLALPLVLALPGYALFSALFPPRLVGGWHRAAFTLGLSVVVAVLGGTLLNLAPAGLDTVPWVALFAGVTTAAAIVGLVRRHGQRLPTKRFSSPRLVYRPALAVALAAFLVGTAFTVSILGAQRQQDTAVAELWMLPVSADTSNVQLGVDLQGTTEAEQYSLVIRLNGSVVQQWASVYVDSQHPWSATLSVPPVKGTASFSVEADLYQANAPTVIYRQVHLWLDASSTSPTNAPAPTSPTCMQPASACPVPHAPSTRGRPARGVARTLARVEE